MLGYVFAVGVLLILWGSGAFRLLGLVLTKVTLKPGQAVAYWALLMLLGLTGAVFLSEFVLPRSYVVASWGEGQVESVVVWAHWVTVLVTGVVFYRGAVRLLPAAPAKARAAVLKTVGSRGKTAPKKKRA